MVLLLEAENLLDENWVKNERFQIDAIAVQRALSLNSLCEIKIFWKGNASDEKDFIKESGTWGDRTSITYTDEGFLHYLTLHVHEINHLLVRVAKYARPEIICFNDTWLDNFNNYLTAISGSTNDLTPKQFLTLDARLKEAQSLEQSHVNNLNYGLLWKLLGRIKASTILGTVTREYEFNLIQTCCDDESIE